jgi:hypothetical protein
MRSRLRSVTAGIDAGNHDSSVAAEPAEAMLGRHWTMQMAAQGQSFGQSGTCCRGGGQQPIDSERPGVAAGMAIAMPPISMDPISPEDVMATGVDAWTAGVTSGANRRPIAARIDRKRVRIFVFTNSA